MLMRPVAPGCQPNGFVKLDDRKGKWGIVAYERPLREQELEEFEMGVFEDGPKHEISRIDHSRSNR